ncbi:MAG: SIS domain-containing protein [Clostridia bacterium]|nr:SIS domain-containing protein [Clostridia bacterium]
MLLDTYQQAAFDLLYKARTTQREAVIAIGERMADAIEHGGRVYLNSICHMIEHDLLNRGGGPAFYRHYEEGKTELKAGDVLFVSSVSGRTLPVVNLAWNAVEKGVIVIALTSMSYAQAVEPVHPSGKKLYEFATYTLDNCAPAAEAMLEVEGLEPRFAAASGIASDFLMWSVTSVCVEKMIADGFPPSVFKSANFPGGPEYNHGYVDKHFEEFGW